MNAHVSTVVIGIGSPHGDDQFGWAVVDALRSCLHGKHAGNELSGHAAGISQRTLSLRKINNPIDLISELESYQKVIVVDACIGLPRSEPFRKLAYADLTDRSFLEEMPGRGTHEIGVGLTLRMSQSLKKPLNHVVLWIGSGTLFEKMNPMSASSVNTARECAAAIVKELCDA